MFRLCFYFSQLKTTDSCQLFSVQKWLLERNILAVGRYWQLTVIFKYNIEGFSSGRIQIDRCLQLTVVLSWPLGQVWLYINRNHNYVLKIISEIRKTYLPVNNTTSLWFNKHGWKNNFAQLRSLGLWFNILGRETYLHNCAHNHSNLSQVYYKLSYTNLFIIIYF